MEVTKRLLIFANVWPEPNSSAAGGRMLQLIQTFLTQKYEVCYACTAAPSKFAVDLSAINVRSEIVALNNDIVDALLTSFNPTVVLFDRFMTEEQFGWRVASVLPNALRVLNTEDLHCVRRSRQLAYKQNKNWTKTDLLRHEDTKREIAAIFRCDVSLIISKVEMNLLQEQFQVPTSHLFHYSFVAAQQKEINPFEKRKGFVTIGNMMHQPNWQSLLVLKKEIWPIIRKLKPNAEVNVYGAYCTEKVFQLNNPAEGFYIRGRADDALTVIEQSKVLLAPITFGAGLKGKLLEAMICGTPSVTTNIGAEGMTDAASNWGGKITNDWNEFATGAIALHDNQAGWVTASQTGLDLFKAQFNNFGLLNELMTMIENNLSNLENHRPLNFTGAMLMHHRVQSTKFMSKWISAKNKQT
jgi:glycosyltransferase involved in cell wall biosynthesis